MKATVESGSESPGQDASERKKAKADSEGKQSAKAKTKDKAKGKAKDNVSGEKLTPAKAGESFQLCDYPKSSRLT